jgi:hypothetical protein
MILTGVRLTYMEKNLCLCHSVYHKSHMDCRGYRTRAFAMRGRPLTALFKIISSFFLSFFLSVFLSFFLSFCFSFFLSFFLILTSSTYSLQVVTLIVTPNHAQ